MIKIAEWFAARQLLLLDKETRSTCPVYRPERSSTKERKIVSARTSNPGEEQRGQRAGVKSAKRAEKSVGQLT